MRDTTRKKRAAVICAAAAIAILGIYLAMFLYPLLGASFGAPAAVGILLVYGLFIAAAILGILLSLRQRLRELDSGEEEDAKKY